MALTDTQKLQVRRYLGYPDINRLVNDDLENAMEALSSEGETLVGTLLTTLEALETKLSASWDRQKVLKAEQVTLAGFDEVRSLRSEGKRIATDLANIFGLAPQRPPFSAGATIGVARRG